MTKTTLKNLAEEAIVLLREMFGEGVEFECIEHFKTNEALTGIALKLPGCTAIPTVNLNDMPDNATAEDIANIAAATFQEALRDFKEFPVVPEMTRENVLANVVLQALSRKRNRQTSQSASVCSFSGFGRCLSRSCGAVQKKFSKHHAHHQSAHGEAGTDHR